MHKIQLPGSNTENNWTRGANRLHIQVPQDPPISRSGLDWNNLLMHHTYSLFPAFPPSGDPTFAVLGTQNILIRVVLPPFIWSF
jgi:hypothetical protein